MSDNWGRLSMIALGAWLFISAFVFENSSAQFNNAWLCGAAAVTIGAISLFSPSARYFNTALAIWLFLSTLALPRGTAGGGETLWNNLVVAVLLFAVSLRKETMRYAGPFGHGRHLPAT